MGAPKASKHQSNIVSEKDQNMNNVWMVRAGEGAYLIEKFARGLVSIGWHELGDLGSLNSRDDLYKLYVKAFPDEKPSKVSGAVAMIYKFRSTIKVGDKVITYDPNKREYLVGTIKSDYAYEPAGIKEHPHIRKVEWDGRVGRDKLSLSSRNTLGSTLTLFSINEDTWDDILSSLNEQNPSKDETLVERKEELEQIREDVEARAHELIKDKILSLDEDEMEKLSAAILRAMGYRTRVSPKGPDRGVDVFASPDGLGLEEPRIKVEVKHRPKTPIGSQDLRSFLGGLRQGDRGLYVSTGGFTKDAKYEADRSNIPVMLLDLDELATLVVTHYENFDLEGRALISLIRVYWPAE
jgi:restriction system protein